MALAQGFRAYPVTTPGSGAAGFRAALEWRRRVEPRRFPGRVHWQLSWPSVTEPALPVEISVSLAQIRIEGLSSLGWPGNFEVSGQGAVNGAEIRDLVRQSGR